jgi:hypothetical protein
MAQAEYLKNSIESGQLDVEDPKALQTALRSALAATPQVTGIGFIRSNLEVARVERRDGSFLTEDWSRRPEIIRVLEDFRAGKGAGWGEPVWSSPFQQTIIPYLMPVHRGGNLIGVLVPAIVVTELSRYVAEISSPAQRAFILHVTTRCWLTRHWLTEPTQVPASVRCRCSPRSTTRCCKRCGRLNADR